MVCLQRPLIDRNCFTGKLKVWELYDHCEVKGQGESQECTSNICSKAGFGDEISFCSHFRFSFYLKNRETQKNYIHIYSHHFFEKKFPNFTVCSRAGKSQLWADSSWLPVFVHVTHELKMITTCLSGQKKTDRRLLKVHAT